MKTMRIFLSALVFGLIGILPANAINNYPENISTAKLKETFSLKLNNIPFEDLMDSHQECLITIKFNVDSNHQITDVRVEGNNEDLIRYITLKLTRKPMMVDPRVESKGYYITYRFITI